LTQHDGPRQFLVNEFLAHSRPIHKPNRTRRQPFGAILAVPALEKSRNRDREISHKELKRRIYFRLTTSAIDRAGEGLKNRYFERPARAL
jgi:hypothetical protein